jgi:hypothetical protein
MLMNYLFGRRIAKFGSIVRGGGLLRNITAVCIALALPSIASAFTIGDEFGPFPNATFGGSGIPNNQVAASTQIVDGDVTITIALAATQRYDNPTVTWDGEGGYFAGAGSSFEGPGPTEGALWNFSFYIGLENSNGSTAKLTDYEIDLFYDFNPAGPESCCNVSGLGRWDIDETIAAGLWGAGSDLLVQDSQNLMFGFLGTTNLPYIAAPTDVLTFDENALGNYQFAISVTDGFFPVESVAMEVNVVPIPAAVWLFGSGLGFLGWFRRRQSA